MTNGLTDREIFDKLLSVVEKNHEAQEATVQVLQGLKDEMDELRKLLQSKLWYLIFILIAALLAAVGIKLAFPTG